MDHKNLRVAIVADWLIDFGGAELVISHLLEMFPHADIFTSVCFMDHPMLQGRQVFTSWIQHIPYLNRKHKLAGIFRPWAFRAFDFSKYDLILSSSSAESKNAGYRKRGKHTRHICYCHTPIRYYWSHAKEYENMMEFGWINPLARGVFRLVRGWMQKVDYKAAQKVDIFLANSNTTADRIRTYYQRNAEVVYPGVHTSGFDISHTKKPYYFAVGRCIPYKKFDLLVDAFNKNGKKCILATRTDTALYRELRKKSKSNIEWRFNASQQEIYDLYRFAQGFLFPPEEDFGLAPVEAMLCGTPVLAYGKGGGTESIIEGKTGVFFMPQTPKALNKSLKKFEQIDWNAEHIRARGLQFTKEIFQKNIIAQLDAVFGDHH